jgi:hypothetical protein
MGCAEGLHGTEERHYIEQLAAATRRFTPILLLRTRLDRILSLMSAAIAMSFMT